MKKLVLLTAMIVGFVFYSCSSDDDNSDQDNVSLVGEWRLTNVDFTKMTEGGIPTTDACIVELVTGYDFRADSKFYFILADIESPINFNGEYWTWEGDTEDFEIIQTNPSKPPYHFGLEPKNVEVKTVDGQTTMTFQAKMGNGSEADFRLVKEKIDKTKQPKLTTPDGEDYYCGFFDK